MSDAKIKVLIVDDSAIARGIFEKAFIFLDFIIILSIIFREKIHISTKIILHHGI